MLSLGKKITAARSLLGWSQQELAAQADVAATTIQGIEALDRSPNARTEEKLVRALKRAGIEMTDDGVSMPDSTITRLDGDGWFLDVLDDAFHALKGAKEKEMLIFGGDNRVSPPEVIEGFRKLRSIGVNIREMVEEGNTYLNGQEQAYRWIPAEYFKNYNTVIYADRVLNDFHSHGVLFTNKQWADTERNKFNLIWSLLPQLKIKSSADVRF